MELLQKKRLLQLGADSLQIVEDNIFKLDNDFDLTIGENTIYILHPSSLALGERLTFLNPATLADYASKHKLAARYVASISNRADLEDFSRNKVQRYCQACNIQICTEGTDGDMKIWPDNKHELLFLKLLDRRVLESDLTDETEYFETPNRKKMRV